MTESKIVETFIGLNFQELAKKMPVIVIYDHPTDFPDKYVARLFDLNQATSLAMVNNSIHQLRERLPYGLIRMARSVHNDPCILEVWI